ncbi:MAG TPA: hypothetical protein ENH06_00585 [bacterium]|nr:hypothetical protein [bacterium]
MAKSIKKEVTKMIFNLEVLTSRPLSKREFLEEVLEAEIKLNSSGKMRFHIKENHIHYFVDFM